MRSYATKNQTSPSCRRGISIVEFVGCLAALGGGVVLGSMYLGVDVKAMAVGILEKADISVPAILDEAAPTTTEATLEDEPAGDPETAPINDDGTTPSEITAGTDGSSDEADETSSTASVEVEPVVLTEAEQLAATKACWSALSEAMKVELNNRNKSIRDPGNWQLFDYLLHRKNGHQQVVEAIEAIDLNGVDNRLVVHVQQVLAWHRSGAELFERAAHLLTDAPAGKLSGPFAQSWQSASTQHRMEENLILNKHKAVANYLEHTQKATEASLDNE